VLIQHDFYEVIIFKNNSCISVLCAFGIEFEIFEEVELGGMGDEFHDVFEVKHSHGRMENPKS
jgi:hypothetical protein